MSLDVCMGFFDAHERRAALLCLLRITVSVNIIYAKTAKIKALLLAE